MILFPFICRCYSKFLVNYQAKICMPAFRFAFQTILENILICEESTKGFVSQVRSTVQSKFYNYLDKVKA